MYVSVFKRYRTSPSEVADYHSQDISCLFCSSVGTTRCYTDLEGHKFSKYIVGDGACLNENSFLTVQLLCKPLDH